MILNYFDVKVVFLVQLGASHIWDAGCERGGVFHACEIREFDTFSVIKGRVLEGLCVRRVTRQGHVVT